MATAAEPQQLSDAIINFALDRRFPADISGLTIVSDKDLQPIIEALVTAKTNLEGEIHVINEETKDDVSSWAQNAKALQEDIIRSKTIANDIVRQANTPEVSGKIVEKIEEKLQFLNCEFNHSQQVQGVLAKIKSLNTLLTDVETARNERRILDSLRLLEQAWTALDAVDVSKTCRVIKLLDHRAFGLKSSIHEMFNRMWKEMINFDIEASTITIHEALSGGMTLSEAVVALEAYRETDERMEQMWRNLNGAIISPRLEQDRKTHVGVQVNGDELALSGQRDASVEALLSDLQAIMEFLAQKLPQELLSQLACFMMADLIPRLIQQWLNPAVPSSLCDIPRFQSIMNSARVFCDALETKGYSGFEDLKDWVSKAHMTWLGRCRETALDTVRTKLSQGIGAPRQVERVEKHMVTVSEGRELATNGAGATADTNDWGAAWDDAWDNEENGDETQDTIQATEPPNVKESDKEDDGTDAWGWDEEEEEEDGNDQATKGTGVSVKTFTREEEDEDTGADAWGWGGEDTPADPMPSNTPSPKKQKKAAGAEQRKELVLKEKYYISSMPEPVLNMIASILEDAAVLTKDGDEYQLIASTAPGLFSLPTFALALFRAISPHYYFLRGGGNMYLYNDAMYMADELIKFTNVWKEREDLTPRARAMLRLENDVKTLQNFANRSYGNEMMMQRTILQDLLGSSQSVVQQDDATSAMQAGISHIRCVATTWESILARSVWSQAIGSLVDALANRIIADVLDLSLIGQDEAYNIAHLIASTTTLENLFLPSKLGGTEPVANEVSTVEQYSPNWPRMKYLGEILQSNLKEIWSLWCEQKLSYYFTAQEVVDLIHASFEDNARTRQTIKDIEKTEYPAVDL